MKYRGKYNLKENLYVGRGMGLLSEVRARAASPAIPSASIIVNGTTMNASSFTALETPSDVHSKLPAGKVNDTGWRTQKKVAAWLMTQGFSIKWIASGAGQPDVLAEKAGTLYVFEVGNPDKSTQLGNVYDDGTLRRNEKTKPYTIDKQRELGASRLRGIDGGGHREFSEEEMDAAFEDVASSGISRGEVGSYWRSDASDFLVMIEENGLDEPEPNAKLSMMALTKEANDLSQSLGWGLKTMANVINKIYASSDGKMGGDLSQSNKEGGSWSAGGVSGRRGGFKAFPADIKKSMIPVN